MPLLTVIDLNEPGFWQPMPQVQLFREENGRVAECVRQGDDWCLRRLISTDPRDYLNPALQPGQKFHPQFYQPVF